MSTINIYDLHPAGSDLFSDSESYMNEMSEGELTNVLGGSGFWCGVAAGVAANFIYENGKNVIQGAKKARLNKQPFDWTQATA
jgi:hypothetical protein